MKYLVHLYDYQSGEFESAIAESDQFTVLEQRSDVLYVVEGSEGKRAALQSFDSVYIVS